METIRLLVYALCALTSVFCALLLARGYRRNRSRLLLYTALCFAGLAVNNLLVFVDIVLLPAVDLSVWRSVAAVSAVGILLYGFVWEVD